MSYGIGLAKTCLWSSIALVLVQW
jgi:hypothetical protein